MQILPIIKLDIIYIPSTLKFILPRKININLNQEYLAIVDEVQKDMIVSVVKFNKIENTQNYLISAIRKVRIKSIDKKKATCENIYDIVLDKHDEMHFKTKIISAYDTLRRIYAPIHKFILNNSESLSNIIAHIANIIQTRCLKCTHIVQSILEQNHDHNKTEKILECIEIAIHNAQIIKQSAHETSASIRKKNNDFIITEQIKVLQDKLSIQSTLDCLRNKYNKIKHLLSEEEKERCQSILSKGYMVSEIDEMIIRDILNIPRASSKPIDQTRQEILNKVQSSNIPHKKIIYSILLNILDPHKIDGETKQNYCIVGPPGTGKTSMIAKVISEYTGRQNIQLSVGGATDANRFQGFSSTYKNSKIGEIANILIKSKTNNPIITFDEIDKIDSRYQQDGGEVSSLFLSMLDDSGGFRDIFLDVNLDLSKCTFIFTANDLSKISAPLLNRLTKHEISSYSVTDKLQITKNHIHMKLKPFFEKHLMKCPVFPQSVLLYMITHYTSELGVRQLLRLLNQLAKYMANHRIETAVSIKIINECFNAQHIITIPKILIEQVGLSHGLAYSNHGGTVITFESTKNYHKQDRIIGNMKHVMQESFYNAKLALINNQSKINRIFNKDIQINNVFIHINTPGTAAIPKDGPSAGIALAISMLSCIYNFKLNTPIAMTGEISAYGNIHEVGGIKEKVQVAVLTGAEYILLPKSIKNKYPMQDYVNGKTIVQKVNDAKKEIGIIYCDHLIDAVSFFKNYIND